MAALGAIPWIGSLISGAAAAWAEHEQGKTNELFQRWLEEHERYVLMLGRALVDITSRLSSLDEEVHRRIESESYLGIVRKGFKAWDNADTDDKRRLIQNLLANAGATRICSDDVVRLFIDWIDKYHEVHFKVIKVVYKHSQSGIGRGDIWDAVQGKRVREDSAEADLFKMLIRDMSTGGIIRQHRETDWNGQFVKKTRRRTGSGSQTVKSAFDNEDPYELTELGKQFVHYTMNEVVPRIGDGQ